MVRSPKRLLIAAGALACANLPAMAQTAAATPSGNAPSSVSMYGVLDVAAYSKQLSGDSRLRTLQSGGMTTSRFGFTGTDDLGGGWRSLFDISGFIRVDTGDSGRSATDPFFGRYAFVGLSSPGLGSIRLGRITTATFLSELSFGAFLDSSNLGPYVLHTFQPSAGQPMITANGLLDSAWSNSMSYTLPAFSSIPGLTASVQVAASEGTAAGRRVGGGVSYRNDSFGASFTFDDVRNGTLSVGAPTAALATSARPQYTANDVRTYQGGAYYDFKVIRLWAQVNQTTSSNATPTRIKLTTSALSATVPIGVGNFLVEWAHTNNARTAFASLERDTQGVGYDHFISKRTDLYAVALRDKVSHLSSGTGLALGIRHRF